MKRMLSAVSIVIFLALLVGCQEREKPVKTENIFGVVISRDGHYLEESKAVPLDCRVVAEVENTTIIATYRVKYWNGAYEGDGPYDKCANALLLKQGGVVNVIKYTWPDDRVTYVLDP